MRQKKSAIDKKCSAAIRRVNALIEKSANKARWELNQKYSNASHWIDWCYMVHSPSDEW